MTPTEYAKYVHNQTVRFASHESKVCTWRTSIQEYVRREFQDIPLDARILDAGCGDGVAIETLVGMGFTYVRGFDLSGDKLREAEKKAVRPSDVYMADMHDSPLPRKYDVLLSMHSLEHCYDPALVLRNFAEILVPDGLLLLLVPFPDVGERSAEVHVGRAALGTNDGARGEDRLRTLVEGCGFEVLETRRMNTRDPELHLKARRHG